MNSRLRVQAAGMADVQALAALAKDIWEKHYSPIIGEAQLSYMLDKFQSEQAIKTDMENGCVYYMAFYEGVPCGYSALSNGDGGIFLSRLYVKQGYRGKGIARVMLDKIYEYAKKNRQKRVWLICSRYDAGSLETYKRLGFSIIDSSAAGANDYALEKIL